jgi:hypothetical protein
MVSEAVWSSYRGILTRFTGPKLTECESPCALKQLGRGVAPWAQSSGIWLDIVVHPGRASIRIMASAVSILVVDIQLLYSVFFGIARPFGRNSVAKI